MNIRNILLKAIPPSLRQRAVDLKNRIYGGYAQRHYSQFGEDVVIISLSKSKKGFYVDVGANHPQRYSNTALLYEHGWRGINIEPNGEAIKLFDKYRPGDINIQSGVGLNSNILTYYRFSDPAVNTFSEEAAQDLRKKRWLVELKSEQIQVRPLREILSERLGPDAMIDFINVDVEGLDMEVLESNDWTRSRPSIIAIEDQAFDLSNPSKSEVYTFLTDKEYSFIIHMGPTSIFKTK